MTEKLHLIDPEVERRIAEEIERQNIDENMNLAIENAPESFGQVVMLWINVRVNGFHVKGKIQIQFDLFSFLKSQLLWILAPR